MLPSTFLTSVCTRVVTDEEAIIMNRNDDDDDNNDSFMGPTKECTSNKNPRKVLVLPMKIQRQQQEQAPCWAAVSTHNAWSVSQSGSKSVSHARVDRQKLARHTAPNDRILYQSGGGILVSAKMLKSFWLQFRQFIHVSNH